MGGFEGECDGLGACLGSIGAGPNDFRFDGAKYRDAGPEPLRDPMADAFGADVGQAIDFV